MIRTILIAVAVAFAATVGAWFIIPASTYVEDALGILMLVFMTALALVFVVRRWRSTK